jgi:hypothetical protein
MRGGRTRASARGRPTDDLGTRSPAGTVPVGWGAREARHGAPGSDRSGSLGVELGLGRAARSPPCGLRRPRHRNKGCEPPQTRPDRAALQRTARGRVRRRGSSSASRGTGRCSRSSRCG